MDKEVKSKLDIVFVSWDEDEKSFKEYFQEMPWKALPFEGMFLSFGAVYHDNCARHLFFLSF